ncbi:hypothetical protein BN1184_AI_00570 [Pantoea ananatis]|nr:hypothetical protein BN1183_AI_01260 [Pantoea ananatis]CRH36907.1 hypothetical protein BN1184_AI_00570 [Pantoea ananatis]
MSFVGEVNRSKFNGMVDLRKAPQGQIAVCPPFFSRSLFSLRALFR